MTEDLKQLRRYVVTANKIMKPTLQLRIEPPAGSGGIGQAHGVGQRIKATFSVSKSLCRKKIYYCLSTPPMLLGAKHQA
jgi:hypothetical protein